MTKPPYIGSGGKKPKTPVITNDNLFSKDRVELLLGVGEGQIEGLENGLKSFFAGDVPLQDNNGNTIIKDLVASEKKGESTPTTITFTLGGESASTSVGVNILQKSPVVRYTPENFRGKINKLDIRITIAQLFHETAGGDVLNNTAQFRIEYKTARGSDPWIVLDFSNATPNGTNPFPNLSGPTFSVGSHTDGKNKYLLEGKTGSGFVIDFRTDVTTLTDDDYIIRVTKFNPDTDASATTKTACDIVFDSFQVLAQPTRTFSNTALMHVTGRANDQFSDIPDFYGIFKGLKTKVPTNRVENSVGAGCYPNPVWTGALTTGWHSNPAWVLYDLLDNPHYGMRKYAPTLNIYTQDFYNVGVYCDNAVSNGFGTGDEKRYTMNITLAENQNGWETLQNLAGAFDAVLYDDGEGNVRLKVDRWVEPRVLFTPETVTLEGFNYSFTDINTQYNSITVSFTNPERGWQETRLKVKNDTFIALNGEIPLDFVAVGCTSESEALRRANARLLTATTEKTIAAFTTTRLGLILDPLEIVYIADPLLGWGMTGRISHVGGTKIYLRDPLEVTLATQADLILQTTTGLFKAVVMALDKKTFEVLTNTTAFLAADIPEYAQYTLGKFTTVDGAIFKEAKPFRITAIEPSKDYNTFQLTALEVNPEKYDILGNPDHPEILIDTDNYTGLNLRQLFEDKNHSLSRQYSGVTFTFDGTLEQQQTDNFLMICAADVNGYAITIGDWTGLLPVGVKPKIIIKGAVKIYGKGGKGGTGGFSYIRYATPIHTGLRDAFVGYGESGQEGGDALFLDYGLNIEVETGAVLDVFGGYGGGYGGRGAVLAAINLDPSGGAYPVANGECIGRANYYWLLRGSFRCLAGAGGAGGYPYGEGGASGQAAETVFNNIALGSLGVPAGASGTKTEAGLALAAQVYQGSIQKPIGGPSATVNTPYTMYNGEGQDGRPSVTTHNSQPYTVNTTGLTFHTRTGGSPTNGAKGTGIINRGNLTLTVNGVAFINSDLYGDETWP